MSEDDVGCIFLWCCRAKSTNSPKMNHDDKTREDEAVQLTIDCSHHETKIIGMDTEESDKSIEKPNAPSSPQNSNGSEKNEMKLPQKDKASATPSTKDEDKSSVVVTSSVMNVEDEAKHFTDVERFVSRLEGLADIIVKQNDNNNSIPGQSSAVISDISEKPVVNEISLCWLENKQWTIANHTGNKDLVVESKEVDQHVNILGCNNCVVKIVGKVNSITIDDCCKCGIQFDDVVTSLNVTKSNRLQIQVIGFVPSISVNETDGLSLYLSEEASTSPIFTSKCSELNILIPSEDNDGDLKEIFIPEQFCSNWNGEKWITEVTDIMK